jgi:hypothetical protein
MIFFLASLSHIIFDVILNSFRFLTYEQLKKSAQHTLEEKIHREKGWLHNFTNIGLEKLFVKMYKMCSSPEIKSDDFENG